jgi:REP element-mobilizing transposase RayT
MQMMKQGGYELDAHRRRLVLESIRELCSRREWDLKAAHVRSNHVHIVVSAEAAAERVLRDTKVQASRMLERSGLDVPGRRRWTHHGSTRYLWQPEHIGAAVQYVVHEQGEPMAVWERPDATGKSGPQP